MTTFGPKTPGLEAYDFVMAHMKLGRMKRYDFNACPGFARWRSFLDANPNASLEACLCEFESIMGRSPRDSWALILIEALAPHAYDGFRERVLALVTKDGADHIVRRAKKLKVPRQDVARLIEKHGRGPHRGGVGAPENPVKKKRGLGHGD